MIILFHNSHISRHFLWQYSLVCITQIQVSSNGCSIYTSNRHLKLFKTYCNQYLNTADVSFRIRRQSNRNRKLYFYSKCISVTIQEDFNVPYIHHLQDGFHRAAGKGMQHNEMSRMRKPTFCICKNKGADQLSSNCAFDQRLCSRYTDSTIPLLSKSKISSL